MIRDSAEATLAVGRSGRVMVIGEGDAARRTLERLFGADGFEVHSAPGTSWRSLVLGRLTDEVELVVLEVSPRLDASSIVAAIRQAYPCVRVVLCSSRESVGGVAAALRAGALAVIMKPFDARHLNELMRLAMDRKPRGKRCTRSLSAGE